MHSAWLYSKQREIMASQHARIICCSLEKSRVKRWLYLDSISRPVMFKVIHANPIARQFSSANYSHHLRTTNKIKVSSLSVICVFVITWWVPFDFLIRHSGNSTSSLSSAIVWSRISSSALSTVSLLPLLRRKTLVSSVFENIATPAP